MFRTHRTEIVFAGAALIGLLSLAALINLGKVAIPVILTAHGVLVWAMVKSETDGFFKVKDMPRAGDPQREFHPLQSIILFIIAIAQVALSAYEVLVG
jgi:hypothetical protein